MDAWPGAGISEALARERAERIGNLRYALAVTIPADRQVPVEGRVVVRFTLRTPARTALDADGPAIHRCTVNGRTLRPAAADGHLVVPAAATRAGENEIALTFTAGDDPLNRRDGLLYTLFVPARAHRMFPCFDQPDLKARLTLTLDLPAGWTAAANGVERVRSSAGEGWRVRFAETPPLPTYLMAFAAGLLTRETLGAGGRTIGLLHHAADADDLARARERLAGLHADAMEWMECYTGIPYPFESADVLLIPAFQFGGMEHPGLVYYDAARLLLPPAPTRTQELERASLVAHETAHMWFGNLVTMRWFSDVWLKEVFANLMAARIVEPAFPTIDHRTRFLLAHHPEAYRVDRSAGTHPIRQPLDDLRDAGQLYGPLVYQKSVIAMRQLEAWIGDDAFQAAIRTYLERYAFGNASWPDLLAILSASAGRDLGSWNTWFEEAGRPEIDTDVHRSADGGIEDIDLVIRDPEGRGRVWPQVLPVTIGSAGRVDTVTVPVTGARVRLPRLTGLQPPVWVLPGGAEGYGLFRLDPDSRRVLPERIGTLTDPCMRAGAWVVLWENVLAGALTPVSFVETALQAMADEPEEPILDRVLGWVSRAFWRLLREPERARLVVPLEEALRREIDMAASPSRKAACFAAYRDVARSPEATAWLLRLWRREETVAGLPLGETDELALAFELAVREVAGADDLLRAQHARTANAERREACTFVMPALSVDAREREQAFDRFRVPEHRRREPWVLQSLRYLNHPLRQVHARRYIRPGLALMADIHRTGDIFFPARWAEALLWGHQTEAAAGTVRAFLEDVPDLPIRLRRLVLVAADELFRAAAREWDAPR